MRIMMRRPHNPVLFVHILSVAVIGCAPRAFTDPSSLLKIKDTPGEQAVLRHTNNAFFLRLHTPRALRRILVHAALQV
ncbi:uncharacterized protein V1518DRAFT_423724 [Limtongia smithiae]|uniref:uncharacterized protein n=1 Tax=Limtongia smithiae TaxID=1125753 RepID=UPI0034CE4BF7